jgi:hypothetical protein
VQLLTRVLRLKGLPHLENKLLGRTRPWRQDHCIHIVPPLFPAQLNPVTVLQKLRPVVKLRCELLVVGGGS